MSLPRFESGNEIFLDEDVLRDSHTPETLIERDEELREDDLFDDPPEP